MKRGNEQSAKKVSKVLYVAKNACMSRITSLNDQNQSTRVEINVLSSYLSAEKLSIPRVNEYEKGRSFFFFFFSSIEKEHESWGGHTMALSSRDKREETVCLPWIMPVDTRRVKKERRGKGGSICSPSCVNFFKYWYLWKI